jgi:sugar lactone lactonase YvrE
MLQQFLTRALLTCAAATMVGCLPSSGGGGESVKQVSTEEDTGGGADAGHQQDSGQDHDSGQEHDSGEQTQGSAIPALGDGQDSLEAVEIVTIATQDDGLAGPRDLEINPHAPGEMWIVSRDDNSTTILFDFGTSDQTSAVHSGLGSAHFASKLSSLAFGAPGFMATAQQEDEITQPSTPADFMGPTLWTSDSSEYEGGHASHYDMLHNSPLSSGVAWDKDNAYWIFDGYHGAIAHYDFQLDHGPGGHDHSDGIVRRYANDQLSVVNGIVAHLAFDRDNQLLYIADTGNNRIAVLETDTGDVGDNIHPNYDNIDQRMIESAVLRTLIDGAEAGLTQPAGLELADGVLYVGDAGSSTIFAFGTDGELIDSLNLSTVIPAGALMGLAVDEQGRIYVANSEDNEVIRIAPKSDD